MKKILIALTLLLLLSHGLFAYDPVAVIRSTEGKVEIMTSSDTWTPVTTGMYVPVGATISTGFDATADIEIGGAILTVEPLTRMRIDELSVSGDTINTDLDLQVGRIRAEVNAVEGLQNDFTLSSPVTTASVRGTSFVFDTINLFTETGLVELSNRHGQYVNVYAGETGKGTGTGLPDTGLSRREQIVFISLYTTDISGPQYTSGLRRPYPWRIGINPRPPMKYGTVSLRWFILD
jgi:hypothetical protein